MRLFQRKSGPEPGSVWSGFATYTTDPHIGPPGFYALEDDGKTINTEVRLTWVDEAPHDEEDGSGHYEVADPAAPYFSHQPMALNPNAVQFEANVQTTSDISVGGDPDAV